jgi:hypothetical protein
MGVPVKSQTMPATVSDERVLEELEAEFLRSPSFWPLPSESDLGGMLAPAIGRSDVDPVCKSTLVKSKHGGCCG